MAVKIGIVTFTNYNNYGSTLQRYAMQEVLASMGYKGESVWLRNINLSKKRIWDFVVYALPKMRERARRFKDFINKKAPVTLFDSEESLAAAHEQYAAFIAGSDQIWRGVSSFFFLEFAANRPKIAYAASGLCHLPQKYWPWAKDALARFATISVREKGIVELAEKISGRKATNVLDPTLLLDSSFWSSQAIPPRSKKPYVFCYFVQTRSFALPSMPQVASWYHLKLTEAMARQLGASSIYLCGAPKGVPWRNFSQAAGAGPQEFLGLIRDAEMVITDSYHAMLFAIQFQKPFFVLPVKWKNPKYDETIRHRSLLETLGLSSRFLPLGSPMPEREEIPIDYTRANEILAQQREESLHFLQDALHCAVGQT